MRSNIVELEIEKLLSNGEGLSSIDTKPIQVRNALPGESVSARILKKRKGIKYSDAVEIKTSSEVRKEPSCQYSLGVEVVACCTCSLMLKSS